MRYIAATVMFLCLLALNVLIFAWFDGYISSTMAVMLGMLVGLCGLQAAVIIEQEECA